MAKDKRAAAKLLGSAGGKARAKNLTKAEIQEIGRQGANKRWKAYRATQRAKKEGK